MLLSHGADTNIPGPELPVVDACRHPNLKGQNLPVFMATLRPELLKILVDNGVDLKKSAGALEMAVYHNSIEVVKMLLEIGIDLNEKKNGVYSPLTTAIRDNRPEILALLLSRGADLNFKGQGIPLVMATTRVGILKQLVEGSADLAKCPGVLESAVYHNNMDSVTYLLDAGVNPNDKNQGLYSPLTTAVRDNRPKILEVLLARGADPNLKGQGVPLVIAVQNPAMLKQLIAGGADVTKYQGLLELAVYHNKMESIDILLEASVPINEKHRNLYSPLTTAIRDNRIDILKHLLSKGADPNTPGEGLPVMNAVRFEDQQRLRLLLNAGADVNRKIKGRSALIEACDRNMVENVKLLLERGTDADLMDEAGKSAMDIAANKELDDIMMLLLDALG